MIVMESWADLEMSTRADAFDATQLDTILTSAEEALSRAEASLRKTCHMHSGLPLRSLVQESAFDAIILERYPEPGQ